MVVSFQLKSFDSTIVLKGIQEALKVREPKAAPQIAELLGDLLAKGGTPDVDIATVKALVQPGEVGAQYLPLAFQHDNYHLTHEAQDGLKNAGASAVGPLCLFLKDANKEVRYRAVQTLNRVLNQKPSGDFSAAIPPLLSALGDSYGLVRSEASEALGKLGDSRPVPPLMAALHDKDARVRGHAALALGRLKASQAVEPLLPLLQDADEHVRSNTAFALTNLKDPRATEPLAALLQDPYEHVREAAVTALKTLNWQPEDVTQRITLALTSHDYAALVKIGQTDVDALIDFLENKEVRFSKLPIAQALGDIGDPRSIPALTTVLERWSEVVQVAESLGKIKDPRVIRPLLQATRHGWIAKPTVDILTRLLKDIAKDLATEDLKGIMALEGADRIPRLQQDATPEMHLHLGHYTNGVDCSALKQLAQAELARR